MSTSFPEITDVHLSTSGGLAVLFPGQRIAGPEHDKLIAELIDAVRKCGSGKLVKLPDGTRWRVQEMQSGRFALRRMRPECPKIENLGLPEWIKGKLLERKTSSSGGLIMILGPTGGGKTTTFSATISGRLSLHGGYCLTIEDPPEDELEGIHGASGFCEQLDADSMGGYEHAMHAALRCFPARDNSILGYGEVRDNSTAAHLLRVALDGHLVIFTAHAKTISAGIARIISMAEAGGELNAVELFSSSFLLAVHQRFNDKRALVVKAISPDLSQPLRSHIAARNFSSIDHEIDRVNTIMLGR